MYHAYYSAFQALRRLPRVTSAEDGAAFNSVLRRLLEEHAPLLDAMALGVRPDEVLHQALQLAPACRLIIISQRNMTLVVASFTDRFHGACNGCFAMLS